MVRTWSRPYGLSHCPYTKAHIKGFGSPYLHVYACLLLCFMHVLAFLVLGFATLDALCGVCGCMVTFDAHEALFGCKHLGCITMMLVALGIPFPLSAPCDDMLAMLVCATRWLSMHLYTLDYMPMHESSVSSMFQHNEIMDIRSKSTFVPRGHNLLFALLLVCLLACACFLVALLAMSIMLIYFMPHSYALCISFFPLLVCWFLVLAFACTHMELGHGLLGASKKGKDASMSI